MAPGSWIPLIRLTITAFVLATNAQLAKSSPTLDVDGNNNFPVRNSSVVLTCSGHYNGILTFSGSNPQTRGSVVWMKDGQRVAEWSNPAGTETPSKYELFADAPQHSVFFAYLRIKSIATADNGEYRCQLLRGETVLGTSNKENVTVEQRPAREYPECSVRSLGNGKAFICVSERGSPSVGLQWWKDGQRLRHSMQDDSSADFVKARVQIEDGESSRGRFECELTFRGERTRSCVLDRPNVTIPYTTSGLSIGQELVVTCITSGKPPVSSVQWTFSSTLHASYREEAEGSVLRIYNISSRDNGTRITCEGHNDVGSNQASSVITLRPLEATVQPTTVELEQNKVPTAVGGLAQFKCRTTPARSPPYSCLWLYNGVFVDPTNRTDRFFVEDSSEHVLSISSVSTVDVGVSVTCRIMVSSSYQPNAEAFLEAVFPPTTTEAPKSEQWPFSTLVVYIIGGLVCLVLVGICCWVSLKAKSLLCGNRDTKNGQGNGTGGKASCNRLNDDFVVDIGMPPELTARPSLVTKQLMVEQESPYQDLEDVSRQRQINEYQRLISNDWTSPSAPGSFQK